MGIFENPILNLNLFNILKNLGEYMVNGLVIILKSIGRNFASAMSGGLAFVMDE
jgi:glutamate synthase domain-containing protein 3